MTARTTMALLIEELRGMADAGTGDYTVGTTAYWNDDLLQAQLDNHKTLIDFSTMADFAQRNSGSTYQYVIYETGYHNWEGSATVMDEDGVTIAGTAFTFDWRLGRVTFTADQAGSARTCSGTIYNVNAAAADVWRKKASYYAAAYDVSTDNHSLSRSQLLKHAKEMVGYYAAQAAADVQSGGAGGAIDAERGDC